MVYSKIKTDMMQALKEKRISDKETLGFLFSQLKNKAIELRVNELEDKDSFQVIQKFVKSLKEEKESYEKAGRLNVLESFDNQINLVESYLPKQLNEDEIKNIISNLDNKDIPNIMKYFKTNYNSQVDMKLVNQLNKCITKSYYIN